MVARQQNNPALIPGLADVTQKMRGWIKSASAAADGGSTVPMGPDREAPLNVAMGAAEYEMYTTKATLLAQVREQAQANGGRPTLEQYRLACDAFAQTDQGKEMVALGKWNPKSYADLSGQDLSGFNISEPKVANLPSHSKNGRAYQVGKNYDANDFDGDHQINSAPINDFYDAISFRGASLRDAMVEPATSFNSQIAEAKNLDNITFRGMEVGDTFTFAASRETYKNAKLEEVNGGTILFAKNTRVDGLEIEGKSASIGIESGASIEHITATDKFRVIKFEMAQGARVEHSDLEQVTISMASIMAGSTFNDVQFGNVKGLDFSGVTLTNVSIDGVPIKSASQLAEFGATADSRTVASVSPEMERAYLAKQTGPVIEQEPAPKIAVKEFEQAASPPVAMDAFAQALSAGRGLNSAMDSLNQPQPAQAAPAAALEAPQVVAAPAPVVQAQDIQGLLASLGVSGGEKTDLTKVSLTENQKAFEQAKIQPEQGAGMSLGSRDA